MRTPQDKSPVWHAVAWIGIYVVAVNIGDALSEVIDVTDAPHAVPDDVTLLLVGGPTHAFSMSRENTRQNAVRQGATSPHTSTGIREWIQEAVPRADLDVATFDTRAKVPGMPGSAAKALRHRGFRKVERGPTFWVDGKSGPLKDGESTNARVWGSATAPGPEAVRAPAGEGAGNAPP